MSRYFERLAEQVASVDRARAPRMTPLEQHVEVEATSPAGSPPRSTGPAAADRSPAAPRAVRAAATREPPPGLQAVPPAPSAVPEVPSSSPARTFDADVPRDSGPLSAIRTITPAVPEFAADAPIDAGTKTGAPDDAGAAPTADGPRVLVGPDAPDVTPFARFERQVDGTTEQRPASPRSEPAHEPAVRPLPVGLVRQEASRIAVVEVPPRVDVHIGTIALEVHAPPAAPAPPAAGAAPAATPATATPPRPERFSPHRYYLRGT